jgi:hypothetical protein
LRSRVVELRDECRLIGYEASLPCETLTNARFNVSTVSLALESDAQAWLTDQAGPIVRGLLPGTDRYLMKRRYGRFLASMRQDAVER